MDLSLIPTEALLTELLRRVDHGAFVWMKVGEDGPGVTTVARRSVGNSHTVVGLLLDAAWTVVKDVHDTSEAAKGDEGR